MESVSVAGLDYQGLERPRPAATPRPEVELPEEVLRELEHLENPDPESRRHGGDVRIYAYWACIAGWWTISVYLVACAGLVVGVTFPRELSLVKRTKGVAKSSSSLGSMVDQRERETSQRSPRLLAGRLW